MRTLEDFRLQIILIFTFVFFVFIPFSDAFGQETNTSSLSEEICNTPSVGKDRQVSDWHIAAKKSKALLRNREIDKAIQWAIKADSIFVEEYNKPQYHAQLLLAICYKDKGKMAHSLHHYQLALANAPGLSSEINTMLNMSEVSLLARDTLAVREYLDLYRTQLGKVKGKKTKAYYFYQYASLLQKVGGVPDTVLHYYKKSLNICRTDSIYEVGSYNCCGIIELYEQQGKIDSSSVWQDSLAFYVQKNNSPLVHLNALLCIGNINLKRKNYQKAISEFRLAVEYAKKANYIPAYQDIFLKLSEASEAVGDYKSSIDYLKEYNTIIDSVGASKWDKRLLELQIKYENTRKEQQLKTLNSRLKAALRLPGLILISSAFIILLLVLFLYPKQSNRKQPVENVKKLVPSEKNLSAGQMEQWQKLQHIFVAEKLYTRTDLNLNNLAKRLNTNRSTLSEVINIKSGKTFTHFVNEYRVKEACNLLADPQKGNLSIEGIGQEVGFNSRSAFYSAFTHEIKQSPASFRKNRLLS